MTDRDRIAAKIRALLSKTTENGCTEDEAISAAAKAAEMLARYNLTFDEVQMRETPFTQHTEQHTDRVGDRLWKIADAVSFLTGSRYWTSRPGVHPKEINFFGFAHEVDISVYLLEICAFAMRQHERELEKQFALLVRAARARKINPYLDGMADRLNVRIKELKEPEPVGTGLIVLRKALIDAAMPTKTQSDRARGSRDLESTYRDGVAAADAVSLNKAMPHNPAAQKLLS